MKKIFLFLTLGSLLIHSVAKIHAMEDEEEESTAMVKSASWEKIMLSPHNPDSANLEIEKAESAMMPRTGIREVFVHPAGIEFFSPMNGRALSRISLLEDRTYTTDSLARVDAEKLAPILKLFFEEKQTEDFHPALVEPQNPLPKAIKGLLEMNNHSYFDKGVARGHNEALQNRPLIERHPKKIIAGSLFVGFTAGLGAMYLNNKH